MAGTPSTVLPGGPSSTTAAAQDAGAMRAPRQELDVRSAIIAPSAGAPESLVVPVLPAERPLRRGRLTTMLAPFAGAYGALRGRFRGAPGAANDKPHAADGPQSGASSQQKPPTAKPIMPDTDAPVAKYLAAVALHPDSAKAHYNLGVVLAAARRFSEAAEHYRQALELRPGYLEARHNLANVLFRQGRRDESIQHHTEVLRASPDMPQAHYNLATVLLAQGRAEEAVPHFVEAARLKPDHVGAHYYLATILDRLGRTEEAIQRYRSVVQLNPRHRTARDRLNLALTRTGGVL